MLLWFPCCLACASTSHVDGAAATAKAAPLLMVSAVPAPAPTSWAPPVASQPPSQGVADTAAPAAEPPPKEPRFVERLAHLRGKLVYHDGAPAAHLPIAIDNGCETLAGFTDSRGRFAFDDVALPARFRSLERFRLSSSRAGDDELGDAISIEPSSTAPPPNDSPSPQVRSGETREIATPIIIEGPAVLYLANFPRTHAASEFISAIDLWGRDPDRGAVIAAARPEQVELARKIGFTVAVLDGDANRLIADARNASSPEAWMQTVRERVRDAKGAWKLAELGASRKPRSRVRVDAPCIKRASAGTPRDEVEHQAP
jgi:hypothetical protein